MKILSVQVLINHGPDMIYLATDLPNGFPIYAGEPMSLKCEVLKGTGVDYVKAHFDCDDIEVIDTTTGEREKV